MTRRLANLKEVAEYLGVSANMLCKRIKRGTIDIPHYKYSNRSYVFDLDDVDVWRETRREEGRAAWIAAQRHAAA